MALPLKNGGEFVMHVEGEEAAFDLHFHAAPSLGVGPPLRYTKFSHKYLSINELQKELGQGKTLFYTGAGISAAAGIPTLHQLVPSLQLVDQDGECGVTAHLLTDPQSTLSAIQAFHRACTQARPTRAHHALATLLKTYQADLLTENVDTLHEQAGTPPERIGDSTFHLPDYTRYNRIVCLGMSCDNKGLLGWYKRERPDGKIIAINLSPPPLFRGR